MIDNNTPIQQQHPYFSIITRVSRPVDSIQDCFDSVKRQTFKNYEHILLEDQARRGFPHANIMIAEAKDIPIGKFVLFLDDDDKLYDDNFLEKIHDFIESFHATDMKVDALMVYCNRNDRLLPPEKLWMQKPVRGKISAQNIIISKEVFSKHGDSWRKEKYAADYTFIRDVFNDTSLKIKWLPVISQTGRNNYGN